VWNYISLCMKSQKSYLFTRFNQNQNPREAKIYKKLHLCSMDSLTKLPVGIKNTNGSNNAWFSGETYFYHPSQKQRGALLLSSVFFYHFEIAKTDIFRTILSSHCWSGLRIRNKLYNKPGASLLGRSNFNISKNIIVGTDRPTDGWTNGWTKSIIEMLACA
jgi:hypothetical protein